ncbi:hypothetical protein B7494_g6574 [Chlorociboria aeruginascens]|nr:hypothetical protein B7494_g6574 [Chlorociboria aeruginascens]
MSHVRVIKQYRPMFQKDECTFKVPTGADKTLEIRQEASQDLPGQPNVVVTGQIVVQRPAQASEHPYGRNGCLSLNVRVGHKDLSVKHNWNENLGVLILHTPSTAPSLSSPHIIHIVITASFPEDTTLRSISIKAQRLSLQISKDATVKVLESSHFATRYGSIYFRKELVPSASNASSLGGKFDSREIFVTTTSGSIEGKFPLHHSLDMYSMSGAISVQVDPQPISQIASDAAHLSVRAESGKIHLQMNSPIPRNYITNIQSTSGDIGGKFYLGSNLILRTTSGILFNLDILPIILLEKMPETIKFKTRTETGNATILMLEPKFFLQGQLLSNDEKLRNLSSLHRSTTGNLFIEYPSSWEGNVYATTADEDQLFHTSNYSDPERDSIASKTAVSLVGPLDILGSVESSSSITLRNYIHVTSKLKSSSSISLSSYVSVDGKVEGQSYVDLEGNVSVGGQIESNSEIRLGYGVVVKGKVVSSSSVLLRDRVVVEGSLEASSQIRTERPGEVEIGGNLVSRSGLTMDGSGSVVVRKDLTLNGSLSISGRLHVEGNVKVNGSGTVKKGSEFVVNGKRKINVDIATRAVHLQLNKLIVVRLRLALPPYTTNPSIYISGILHIAPIYITFESLWLSLLEVRCLPTSLQPASATDACDPDQPFQDSNNKSNISDPHSPEICPRVHSLLLHARLPGLLRAGRLRADIRTLAGIPEHKIEEHIEAVSKNGRLAEFIVHIKQSVQANPPVLLAYAWVLYMALFSGGRYLRASLQQAGGSREGFWTRDPSPIRPFSINNRGLSPRRKSTSEIDETILRDSARSISRSESSLSQMRLGLQFFHFAGEEDGEDIKREFSKRINEAEALLTNSEKDGVVIEAQHIFHFMVEMVYELDSICVRRDETVKGLEMDQARPLVESRDSVAVAQERLKKRNIHEDKQDMQCQGTYLEGLLSGSVTKFVRRNDSLLGLNVLMRSLKKLSKGGSKHASFDESVKLEGGRGIHWLTILSAFIMPMVLTVILAAWYYARADPGDYYQDAGSNDDGAEEGGWEDPHVRDYNGAFGEAEGAGIAEVADVEGLSDVGCAVEEDGERAGDIPEVVSQAVRGANEAECAEIERK